MSGLTTIKGTTLSDTGQLGAELLTTGTGTNWTGSSFATGYLHTTGSTVALTTSVSAVIGTYYQMTWTITGRTAGTISFNFGGTGISAVSTSGNNGNRAVATTAFSITPTSDFNGTVIFSIKAITPSTGTLTLKNSAGTITNEIRATNSNTNVLMGVNAGSRLTTGTDNLLLGYNAGQNLTSGVRNVIIGSNCATGLTYGSDNIFIGQGIGASIINASSNVIIGTDTGISLTTAVNNTFIGIAAGRSNNGSGNSGFGRWSGYNNTTGISNTFLGTSAGFDNTTGSNNVFIGIESGRFLANGSSANQTSSTSIFIGYFPRALSAGNTNQIVIGNSVTGLGSNTTIIGNTSTLQTAIYGNLTLGNTVDNLSGAALQVSGKETITSAALNSEPLDVIGVSGDLFKVTDSNTGTLLEVYDSSSNKIFEINNNGAQYLNSDTTAGMTSAGSPVTVYQIDKTTGTAAFFDYVLYDTTAGAYRAGNIMAVWDGTNVEFTETSTLDLGASTAAFNWSVDISGANVRLKATIASGTWTAKIGARIL